MDSCCIELNALSFEHCGEGGVVQQGLQRERALGDERGESRSSANDDHLCLIAVIGGERPLKETQESFTRERETETCVCDCLAVGKLNLIGTWKSCVLI